MAETQAGTLLTEAHRQGQITIAERTFAQALTAWSLLDVTDVDSTRATWLSVMLQIVLQGHADSETLAGNYLTAFYTAEAGYSPTVVKAGAGDDFIETVRRSLDVTGPATIKTLTAAGYTPERAAQTALSNSQGAAARHVLNGSRDTVTGTVAADPITTGWRRIGVGENCRFCNMLIGRGEVYRADTVRFSAHDRCNCQAEPAWGGEPVDLMQYTASKRTVTQAEKDTLKNYLSDFEGMDAPKDSEERKARKAAAAPKEVTDVDAGKSAAELRSIYDQLAPSYAKFPTAATKRRMDDLERKISERS